MMPSLRTFVIVLAVSIGMSIGLWNFGIAPKIWPSHPLLATTLIAMFSAMAVQTILMRDEARQKPKR
jgi:hypothetical protein